MGARLGLGLGGEGKPRGEINKEWGAPQGAVAEERAVRRAPTAGRKCNTPALELESPDGRRGVWGNGGGNGGRGAVGRRVWHGFRPSGYGFRLCARRGAAGAQGASLVGLRLSAVCTIVVTSSAVGFRCVTEVLCPMPFGLWPSGRAFAVEKGGEKCTVFRQKPRAFCRKWKPFAEKAGASCRKAQFGRAGRCFVGRGAPFIARRRGYR